MKLTAAGKALVGVLILAIAGLVYYFVPSSEKDGSNSSSSSIFSFGKSDEVTIGVNTYCGFSPIAMLANEYAEEKFNLKINLKVIDDFGACRAAFKNNDIQIAYCTLDALPVEMSANGTMTDARYFMPLNFSAGADAIVVTNGINTVSDLRGKKIAFAEGTASHTLILNTLETAGLTQSDVVMYKVEDGCAARDAFNAKQVDAACVWAPDDEECLAAVPGSKVLTSTAVAPMMVSDGFIAKKEWLEKNEELATKVAEAIYWANAEVMNNSEMFNKAANAFADMFDSDVDFAKTSASKINYMTVNDAANWIGLNSDYTGYSGADIYKKMSQNYSALQLCKSPLSWNKVAYTKIIENLLDKGTFENNQNEVATKTKEFSAPVENMNNVEAFSNKKVSINFATASYTLDNEARQLIDYEFVNIAKQFTNARIRVEGNTDATGNYDANVALSKKRAQAVVDYLVSSHNLDRNRFIVIGNGPKHAVENGVKGADANYRTTDFQLIAE